MNMAKISALKLISSRLRTKREKNSGVCSRCRRRVRSRLSPRLELVAGTTGFIISMIFIVVVFQLTTRCAMWIGHDQPIRFSLLWQDPVDY